MRKMFREGRTRVRRSFAKSLAFGGILCLLLSVRPPAVLARVPDAPFGTEARAEAGRSRGVRWYEVLISLAVSAACAGGAVWNVKKQYAMKGEYQAAERLKMAYRADAGFALRAQNDVLVNSFVTQQAVPRAPGGGRRGGFPGGGARPMPGRPSGGRGRV